MNSRPPRNRSPTRQGKLGLGLLDFLFYLISPWLSIPSTLLVLAAMTLAAVSLSTGNTFGGLMAGSTGIEQALAPWLGALFIPGLGWGTLHWWRIADEPLHRCLLAGLCYPVRGRCEGVILSRLDVLGTSVVSQPDGGGRGTADVGGAPNARPACMLRRLVAPYGASASSGATRRPGRRPT